MKLDENGVPYLSRSRLEGRAERILNRFQPDCLSRPKFTPLVEIANRLQTEHGVPFRFDMDLGYTADGDKILGRFHFKTRTVFVDAALDDEDPRFHFTLAHEIAHLVLHAKLIPKSDDAAISDTRRDLYLDRLHAGSPPRDWIEWQANTLAAAIVLPRQTVRIAVVIAQEALGITRSLGTVYVDDQPGNKRDAQQVLRSLQDTYRVSRTAARIRLRELGILVEEREEDVEALGDIIGRVVNRHMGA